MVPGHTYLVEVLIEGNDAVAEVLDANGTVIARADDPVRRTGTRRALAHATGAMLAVQVAGKEHAGREGSARVRLIDLASIRDAACLSAAKALAAADAAYASGQSIVRGASSAPAGSAHQAFQQAADDYLAAEQALSAASDRQLRGETALALAAVNYQDLQDWAKSARWAGVASEMLRDADAYEHARAEALAAQAWLELALSAPRDQPVPGFGVKAPELFARSRQVLARLRRFHTARGELYDAGVQQTNIGMAFLYEGRYPECAAAFKRSGVLFSSLAEPFRLSQAHQDEAVCQWGLGHLQEALGIFNEALAQAGNPPPPASSVLIGGNTALIEWEMGRFDDSLGLFDRTLELARQQQSALDVARCLYGIGLNYYSLGDDERARQFLEQALVVQKADVDVRGRVATLRALATVADEQDRPEEALDFDRQALALTVNPSSVQHIAIPMAVHEADAGQIEAGRERLDHVLAEAPNNDQLVRARAHLERAILLRRLGQTLQGAADLAVALPLFHRLGTAADEFQGRLELARSLRERGKGRAALAAVDQALVLADAVRLQTANPELRSQLQAPLREASDLKLELLRDEYEAAEQAGRGSELPALAAQAFLSADAARGRALADLAARRYPSALSAELAQDLRRRESLYRELAGVRFALEQRLDRAPPTAASVRDLVSEVAELQRQVDAVNTRITRRIPRASAGASLRATLPELPADTALVSYWLGTRSAYAWVVSDGSVRWVRLDDPKRINAVASSLHQALARLTEPSPAERLKTAAALYALVVQPLAANLDGVRHWLITPDGNLDYVPFAALRAASGAFVVAVHDVALIPAAWMLRRPAPAADPQRLLMVDDPVYQNDDPRLKERGIAAPLAGNDYQRLPFTAREAAQIDALFAAQDVERLSGLDATRERLLALDLGRYAYLHFAVHGTVDAQIPQLSALMLGSYDARAAPVDGAVRVADLTLRSLNARLVVFSACDTALGKQTAGDGLQGLGSTVLARGAEAVVASLWPVPDESGAALMTDFYRHLLHDSLSASAALSAAMRSVVDRNGSADPAQWAAFQVSVVALGRGQPGGDSETPPARP